MYRDEAIKLMCDVVNNYNRQVVSNPQSGISAEQVEQFIQQGAEQLAHMNGLIYDNLKQHGVIN